MGILEAKRAIIDKVDEVVEHLTNEEYAALMDDLSFDFTIRAEGAREEME